MRRTTGIGGIAIESTVIMLLLMLGLATAADSSGPHAAVGPVKVVATTYTSEDTGSEFDPRTATPTAIASADFDEDGVRDLVCGYAVTEGGTLTLHRGNVDALFPNSPNARARRAEGRITDEPFLSPARVFLVEPRPDLLVAGDFNRDGHADVIAAILGGTRLYLINGNGRGELRPAESLEVPGAITTLTAGEINRADGLPDLAVGVQGPGGAAVLVFQGPLGAWHSEPEILQVAESPTQLLMGRYGGQWHDLAVVLGDELWIFPGRDRQLLRQASKRTESGPPVAERITMPSSIDAIVWGEFADDPKIGRELAVLLEDGELRIVSGDGVSWTTVGNHYVPRLHSRALMLGIRVSGSPTEDLAIVDASGKRFHVVAGIARGDFVPSEVGYTQLETIASVDLERPAVAALPMRLDKDSLTDVVLLQSGASGPTVAAGGVDTTITVNTSLDNAVAGDAVCSLREALNNSNSDSDTTAGDCAAGSGTDAIEFSIGGGGSTATIVVGSILPAITDAVTIDGTSQGCANPPCIALNGAGAGAGVDGLTLSVGSSTIRGLAVHGFGRHGIFVTSSGNTLEGNHAGTDLTGTVALGNNNAGFRFDGPGSGNTIGGTTPAARNVLSGNGGSGVFFFANSNDNEVLGNYIGTDITGTVDLGNNNGVGIQTATGNTVGGVSPGSRNIISGNDQYGVHLVTDGDSNLVKGNYIGTDVSGTLDLGNTSTGVRIWGASNNTIGGTSASARNIISGNDSNGVSVFVDSSTGNEILGNYIGTDVTGGVDLGNFGAGVEIEAATNNTVGGAVPGAGNLISGNDNRGTFLQATSGNSVLGNLIGTDAGGTADLGNSLTGVHILEGSANTIGGTSPEARNVISGNDDQGILIQDSSDNTILGNYIGTDVTGGVDLGNVLPGVEIDNAPNNTVGGDLPGAGNLISGNDWHGILVRSASGNTILGNLIGTDASGTADLGNTRPGVQIYEGANNTVGGTSFGARNVISGNDSDGVMINESSSGNEVLGNLIGTDITGTLDVGNTLAGVEIDTSSTNNTVGGTSPGSRNIISGNGDRGVLIESSSANTVLGNYIGTDVTGTVAMGNTLMGIDIVFGSDNTIGGTAPGARNVISGNHLQGVRIYNTTGNTVLGNYIGTDSSGLADLGNAYAGVLLETSATSNTIGGATESARNVISGNGTDGVVIVHAGTTSNSIQGNCIGTDVTCRAPLGNDDRGVRIYGEASYNTVGGAAEGEGNVIAHNSLVGVGISSAAVGNSLLCNLIVANGGLGVDLLEDGVTANDSRDRDSGPNDLQNYPVLTVADATPTPDITIDGSLESTGNDTFRIEFFASSTCDGPGHGEGERYLGFSDRTTSGQGTVSFVVTLPAAVSDSESITATATNPTSSTSEFSACITASCSSLVVFAEALRAPDKDTLVWTTAQDVRVAKGDLAAVSTYTTIDDGVLIGVNSLDISEGSPAVGSGLYYLVEPLGCGSWQTSPGAEPGRESALP